MNGVVRAARIMERRCGELGLAQFRVLAAIAAGDDRASRIAHHLALGKPAVSSTVDALCRRGLLTRESVENDQRAAALALTDEGRRVLADAEADMAAALDDLVARTGEPALVLRALGRLACAAEAARAERWAR